VELIGTVGLWLTYGVWGLFAVVIVFVLYVLPLYRWVCKVGNKLFGGNKSK